MSFVGRLIHDVTLLHAELDDTIDGRDGYGQPTVDDVVRTELRGLVQPLSAKEVALATDAGAEVTDHRIFLEPLEVIAGDAIEYDGRRYEIRGVKRYEFGRSPHLELDARLVGVTPAEAS